MASKLTLKQKLAAWWKCCLSFRKHDWLLTDYPIAIREREFNSEYSAPRFKQHRYMAYIINWSFVFGEGETRDEAIIDLRHKFEIAKQDKRKKNISLPRPGTEFVEPIEFGSQERVTRNRELSEDFIRRILNLDWAWISDESSLWDFHTDQTNELLHARIREVYGLDVSDIESAKLCEIFDRIAAYKALPD